MNGSVIPEKYQKVGSAKNYILASALHTLRSQPPYKYLDKHSYFKKYEPILKELLTEATIIVLRDETDWTIYQGVDFVTNKKIIAWLAFKQPNTFIFAYTRASERGRGYFKLLWNQAKIYLELNEGLNYKFHTPALYHCLKKTEPGLRVIWDE